MKLCLPTETTLLHLCFVLVISSTQGLAVSHVVSAGSTDVGPFQEQVRQPVQAEAGGEGTDEAVNTP